MKTYTPSPLNAENITLPDNLTELTEAMARNVHEAVSYTHLIISLISILTLVYQGKKAARQNPAEDVYKRQTANGNGRSINAPANGSATWW